VLQIRRDRGNEFIAKPMICDEIDPLRTRRSRSSAPSCETPINVA
jgi:hypothetical protein